MNNYRELAQAFVVAGLLSEADVGAAADILTDSLAIGEARDAAASAVADMADQENLKQEGAVWTNADLAAGDWDAVDKDAAVINEAEEAQLADQEIISEAEDDIAATFSDATEALIAAGLVKKTDYDAAVALITNIWVVDAN